MAASPLTTDSADDGRPATSGRSLRLLVLSSDTFPPHRVDVSVLFGKELARRGHTIDWILQSEAACSKAHVCAWGGGTALVGPTDLGSRLLDRLRKHLLDTAHDLKLFGLLRRRRYDVVEVKDKFVSALLALAAARLFRVRFVYWLSYPFPEQYLHEGREGTGRYPLLYRIRGAVSAFLLYRIVLPWADHVFVQSEQMKRDVANYGVRPGKMTAVPMGIELDAVTDAAAARPRAVIPPGEPSILYLGTLVRVRRLDFLVRVLALVRRHIPEAKLYLVGRGEDERDEQLLRDEAQRLGLSPAVVLVGQLPRGEALRYVQEADVCVSPFYPTPLLNSTSPTKLVEYMGMAKAVVANDHPEQRSIIEQSGAGYCVPWEEQAFADAIVDLLRSPERRASMGERGRRYVVQHRSYRAIGDLVEREFLRVATDAG